MSNCSQNWARNGAKSWELSTCATLGFPLCFAPWMNKVVIFVFIFRKVSRIGSRIGSRIRLPKQPSKSFNLGFTYWVERKCVSACFLHSGSVYNCLHSGSVKCRVASKSNHRRRPNWRRIPRGQGRNDDVVAVIVRSLCRIVVAMPWRSPESS